MSKDFWLGLFLGLLLAAASLFVFGFYLEATNQMFLTVPA